MKKVLRVIAYLVAGTSFGLSRLYKFRVKSPAGMTFMLPKMLTEGIAPVVGVLGVAGGFIGLVFQAPLALVLGIVGATSSASYIWATVTAAADFDKVFGPEWQSRIPPERAKHMLKGRWTWLMPTPPEPRYERDVTFYTVPGSGREVVCDIWQPPAGTEPSGLAYIYAHGSAWHYLDKDFMTRPYFRHLAAQGHVVMDIAYRLCPEVEVVEMLGDVKRAIAWMKRNAGRYDVDPQRIVVAGGSAGGHLALLAAYTPGHPDLTPADLAGEDTSVLGVVSVYGPVDLAAMYTHNIATTGEGKKEEVIAPARPATDVARAGLVSRVSGLLWKRLFGDMQITMYPTPVLFRNLLGGTPQEAPVMCELASPTNHVHPGCPPTLLLQGEFDTFVPVGPTREMYKKLLGAGARVAYVEFPQSDHGFDLPFPRLSPPAQVALYETERFLALLAVEKLAPTPVGPTTAGREEAREELRELAGVS